MIIRIKILMILAYGVIGICLINVSASLPDAIASECAKCSEKQKIGSEKVIKHLIEKKPDQWTALEKKYDPQGTYKAKYAEEAAKRGIKI